MILGRRGLQSTTEHPAQQCAQKLTNSQLNLPHGPNKKSNEETKKQKTEISDETVQY